MHLGFSATVLSEEQNIENVSSVPRQESQLLTARGCGVDVWLAA